MRVLITGSNGFIGTNLCFFLRERNDVEILTFDKENTLGELKSNLEKADFIFHLAGVNRPKNIADFQTENTDLTKQIIDFLNQKQLKTPLIFTSSIQAELDNDYGSSKKSAEDYILDNYQPGIIFRLHNVFGKYCRPNYNSVVATFCYNIAHNQDIKINDRNTELSLIYIDDICQTFIDIIDQKIEPKRPYNYIEPIHTVTLGVLADLLYAFKDGITSISVPETGDDFIKKLFSTFISYCEIPMLTQSASTHTDERGSFSELVHTKKCGQFSVSTSKPGVVRGNHYHHTKIEQFIVISGQAEISLRKIDETTIHKIPVSDKKIQIITIPVGYTHNIRNTGDTDMILLIWCNEIFNPEHPDTYYLEV